MRKVSISMTSRRVCLLLCLALGPLCPAVSSRASTGSSDLPATIKCAVIPGHSVSIADATAKGLYADIEYARYYFCSEGCAEAFGKNPRKYTRSARVLLSLIGIPEEVPCSSNPDHKVKTGDATGKSLFIDHDGRRHYFCSESCRDTFVNDHARLPRTGGVPIGAIPLPGKLGCGVMPNTNVAVERAIRDHAFADYKGRRYLFCCDACPALFKADPAKYARNASLPSPKAVE